MSAAELNGLVLTHLAQQISGMLGTPVAIAAPIRSDGSFQLPMATVGFTSAEMEAACITLMRSIVDGADPDSICPGCNALADRVRAALALLEAGYVATGPRHAH